ncbi:MAG: hypothetical protein FWE71_00920 [Nocardioidaceae bacterium]|nr:hypothetical protein [Nocardioidaceae bacterium]
MTSIRRLAPASLAIALLTTGFLACEPGAAHATTPLDDAVAFTSSAPSPALIGTTYTPVATDPAGGAVTYTATVVTGDADTCSVGSDGTTIELGGSGVCVVEASASGAITAQQSFAVREPSSCAEAVSAGLLSSDGYIDIDLDHQPLHVWCGDTAGTPKTYVDLQVTGAGHNFGQTVPGNTNWFGTLVTTTYTRARLDPATSQIDNSDQTYSSSTGGPVIIGGQPQMSANLAQASGCDHNVSADANLDLTGTGLALPRPSTEFMISGFEYGGFVTTSPQVVNFTYVGGWCGGGGPIIESTATNPDGATGTTTFAVAPVAPDGTAYTTRDLAGLSGIPSVVRPSAELTLAPDLAAGTDPTGFGVTATGDCSTDGAGDVLEVGAANGWCTVTGQLATSGDLGPSGYVQETFPVVSTTTIDWSGTVPTQGVQGNSWAATAYASDTTDAASIAAAPAGVCSVSDGAVQYDGPGTCTVTASQAGDTFHDAASTSTDVDVLGTQTKGTVAFPATPKVGVEITPTTSGWDTDSTLSYTWTVDGTTVSTAATYTPVPADQGHTLELSVDGVRTGYVDSAAATTSATVGLGDLTAGSVAVSGTAQVDSTLTADVSGFGPETTGYAYTWNRDGQPLSGADASGSTYVVTPADAGHQLSVTVVGQASGYADTDGVTSDPTASVVNGTDMVTGSVTIVGASPAGRVKQGQVLTARTASWDRRGTLAYQWTVGGDPIAAPAGAGSSLRILPAWAGQDVAVTVTESSTGQDDVSADAGPVLVVKNPTVTAHYPRTPASGWYRHPIRVTFTCDAGTAAVLACPAPVLLGQGTHRPARSIRTLDGGTAAVRLPAIRVDDRAPVVRISAPSARNAYGQAPRCSTSDAGSGHVSCTVRIRKVADAAGWKVTYRVTARDRAGNVTRMVRSVQADRLSLVAPERAGAYQVRQHGTYRVVMLSASQPRLLYAAPTPRAPHGGDVRFRPDGRVAGMRRWTLSLTITSSTRYSRSWVVGATTAGHTYVAALHVIG